LAADREARVRGRSVNPEHREFFDAVGRRLQAGAITYAGAAETRPLPELLDEITEELEDVCGWSVHLWRRVKRVRVSLLEIETTTPKEERS
jgi:hypothetical protein